MSTENSVDGTGNGAQGGGSPTPSQEDLGKSSEEIGASGENGQDDGTGDSSTPKKQRNERAEKRIAEITGEKKAKEAENAKLQARNKELEDDAEKRKLEGIKRPNRDDFGDDQAYFDAVDAHQDARQDLRSSEKNRKSDEVANKSKTEEAYARSFDAFNERAAKLDPKLYPDMKAASGGQGVNYSALSMHFVRSSKVGPQIAHHFYQNPEIADEIGHMPVAEQVMALNKVQEDIVKASSSNKTPGAPAPLNTLGSGGTAKDTDLDKLSMGDFAKKRNAEMPF